MKRLITILLICLLLSSCAKNHSSEEFFIHSVAFDNGGKELKLYAVCEKMQGEKSKYFIIDKSGKTLEDITKSIKKDYKNCYFATAELYFFSTELTEEQSKVLAKDLLESNIYPLKEKAVLLKPEIIKWEYESIKEENDINKLIDKYKDKGKNTAVYLSRLMEDNQNDN